jgi:hypothetical protein
MNFEQYIRKNHPEFFEEGILDSLAKNKGVRNAIVAGSLAAAGFGLGSRMSGDSTKNLETERPGATQRLPGTYEAGIRTFDEKGRPIKLSQQDQKRVDAIRNIRKMNGGGVSGGNSNQASSVSYKSRSDF